MNLVTLAEYKAYQGIASTNQDTEINTLIPIASKLCKTYCRRSFNEYVNDSKVEVFSGGSDKIYLTEFPTISVESVELSTDFGANYSEFSGWALDKELDCLIPVGSENFPRQPNGYRVTYYGGFEEVPADLKVAVMDLVTYYLKNDMAVKSNKLAGSNTVQVEYITKNTLPSHISRVLDMYLANVS